ncbi:MAG: immune inhibitor A [Anaerolineales bacterium]|nr:immune inhibitor A [Anaerolineales bacterium]
MQKSTPVIPIILVILLAVCCCLLVVFGSIYLIFDRLGSTILPSVQALDPFGPTPTPVEVTRVPIGEIPTGTLQLLEQTIVPANHLPDLACRLQGNCDIPETVPAPSVPLTVGTRQTFWANDTDANENFQVEAELLYITEHAYFWAETGIRVDENDMRALLDTFENEIYPTNRAFFGSEWTPGVDNDPHIYILYLNNIGFSVAGYFSLSDEFHPLAHEYSNAHEMFYINATQDLGAEYTYGVLSHEFQHMIHWYQDANEGAFIDEGFAELATHINGYGTGGFDWFYANTPDIPLTDWLPDPGTNTAHYGANFLFSVYFLDRFGDEITQAVVNEQTNGLYSVDVVLEQHQVTDPLTGELINADDFFLDWTIANYIHDAGVGDGRYFYSNYPNSPQVRPTETIATCPLAPTGRDVNQYGVDYIQITCSAPYTITFSGSTTTRVIPADPHSGSYVFWSNKGDQSDMTMTRTFDLSSVSGPVAMTYWTWYDIEEDWDYVYVEASTDGMQWDILISPSGTDEDPMGNSYGWGYTGLSNGWIEESVDLSAYAGAETVYVRFEYVTDARVNGEGFLVDDIAIAAIGYSEDFEAGTGSWDGTGFVRIENILPQTFRLALILEGADGTTVQIVEVSSEQTAEISVPAGTRSATLVVTATNRFTRLPTGYEIEIR